LRAGATVPLHRVQFSTYYLSIFANRATCARVRP